MEAGGMRRAQLLFGVIGVTLLAFGGGAIGQVDLPPGPDRDLVARTCQTCHDLQLLVDAGGLSRAGWDGTLDQMTGFGLQVTSQERAKILDYLAAYLGQR